MTRTQACKTCIHKDVCEHCTTLRKLQYELNDILEHTYFMVHNQYDRTLKLNDFDFIKAVKIECKHYLRDTTILED